MTPEEWINSLTEVGEKQYLEIYVNEDGKTVTLEIGQNQKEFWKNKINEKIINLQNNFKKINENYSIEIKENYEIIDMYYNQSLSIYDGVYYVLMTEVLCAFQQLLNGVNAEEWWVEINIYNSDTSKIVTTGDSENGLTYDAEDWQESYK